MQYTVHKLCFTLKFLLSLDNLQLFLVHFCIHDKGRKMAEKTFIFTRFIKISESSETKRRDAEARLE